MVQVFVGGREIMDQGHVWIFSNEEAVEFTFDDGDGELTVCCLFETDEDYAEGYLDYEKNDDDDQEYTLRFLNFNTPTKYIRKKPIHIGTYDGRKLYFRYVVEVFNGYKKMNYTWYLE